MTDPRQIVPGRTYLITRRCTQRQFLLRPSRVTNQNIEYCLALAAEQSGVLLHAACFMSNHWHGVVTDPEARLPEFLETFHKLVAKVQNASLGRWENFWSSDKPSVVVLVSDTDVIDKMAYTIANPTVSGLVRAPEEWPGVLSRRFGERRLVEMPDIFFDGDGTLPDDVELHFVRPPICMSLSDAALYGRLRDAIAVLVKRTRDDMTQRGVPFVGRKGVLRQSVDFIPSTVTSRRTMSPRVAAKHAPARIIASNKVLEFVRAYRRAWQDWRAGSREIVFPFGTYALRLYAGVNCAPAPHFDIDPTWLGEPAHDRQI